MEVQRTYGILGPECGHHCGVVMTGKVQHVGHCPCPECHGAKKEKHRATGAAV